jgi:ketosteroid isomerase-like protein
MFERFTEKARRAVFFARHEASLYGSPVIDSEHMLIGVMREDKTLLHRLIGPLDFEKRFRQEVEKLTPRRERIPTSVEIPLTQGAREILLLAAKEADKLGHAYIGTEHLLLGVLRQNNSLGATLLASLGANLEAVRKKVAEDINAGIPVARPARASAILVVRPFLDALREGPVPAVIRFFDEHSQFIDASGKRWAGRDQIEGTSEALFAPFAKKNAGYRLEETIDSPPGTKVVLVLWEFGAASGERSSSMLHMSIVLAPTPEAWRIVLVQLTPCLPPFAPRIEARTSSSVLELSRVRPRPEAKVAVQLLDGLQWI